MLRAVGAGIAVCGLAACALVARQPQRLPDGSYRAACDASLMSCLEPFERICAWHGYDVISASENRRADPEPELVNVTISSEAVVRCKQPQPLLRGGAPPSPPPPASSPPPAPMVPAPVPDAVPVPDGGSVPGGPESRRDECREGPSRDRSARCRELRPLTNSPPPSPPRALDPPPSPRNGVLGLRRTRRHSTTGLMGPPHRNFDRPRSAGDFHGQAPLLWTASALMRQEPSR
jgi:hypothetical protein